MTKAIKHHLQSLCNCVTVDCVSFFVTSDVGFHNTFGVGELLDSDTQGRSSFLGPILGFVS